MTKLTTRPEAEALVKRVISLHIGLDADNYDVAASLHTLGGDSLDSVEIGMEIEDHLNIEIEDECLTVEATPQTLIDLVCTKLGIV